MRWLSIVDDALKADYISEIGHEDTRFRSESEGTSLKRDLGVRISPSVSLIHHVPWMYIKKI